MSAKHTPGPWELTVRSNGSVHIGNPRIGHTVFDSEYPSVNQMDEHDATFIVRACNAHDALVQALRTIADELQAWNSGGDPRSADWPVRRIKLARAALAAAEEE